MLFDWSTGAIYTRGVGSVYPEKYRCVIAAQHDRLMACICGQPFLMKG